MVLLLFLAVRMPVFIRRPSKALYHMFRPATPQVVSVAFTFALFCFFLKMSSKFSHYNKILVMSTIIASIIFMNLYRQNLLFSILRPDRGVPIRTFEELVDKVEEGKEQRKYKYHSETGSIRLHMKSNKSLMYSEFVSPTGAAGSRFEVFICRCKSGL